MTKLSLRLAPLLVLAAAGAAHAGGKAGTVGVGGEVSLSSSAFDVGTGAASVNYDAGVFHVGGFVGLQDPAGNNNTNLEVGARFYYHIHSTLSSDFGIGGTIEIASIDHDLPGNRNRTTELYIQPGFQFRSFLNGGNVALSLSGGLTIGAVDADGLQLGSQFNALAGLHYYFF